MTKKITRRRLLSTSGQAIVGGGAAAVAASVLPATAEPAPTKVTGVDYYAKLGVSPLINAAGTYTLLTASTMPPEVQAAVALAAKSPVSLNDLLDASGEYLAKKLRCEAALVTAGAASALTLGTAACITHSDRSAIHRIPTDMTGLKNEVIVQKKHRYEYDHALVNCGVKFVEVETLQDYQSAFTDRTVMCHFFNAATEGQISREDWVRIAHDHGAPCFNDAAADVPPISNLWNYTQMGFDLVAFSGGKGLRGPQCTGLLLGKKELIEAAKLNSSPYANAIGRGMKVAKEEIVGLVAAVDWMLNQTDEALESEFRRRTDAIVKELKGLPTLESQVVIPPVANHVPHLVLSYDQNRIQITGREVMQKLREGNPRIELTPGTGSDRPLVPGAPSGPNTIIVGVWMLQPGEDVIVGKRLREVLQASVRT